MYTLAPSPQQIFIDPDTMQVASSGFVWFYRDADRTTIKPVYRNTGTPGNPIYTQVPLNPDNSFSLNASGAFPYFIYYYPYTSGGVIDYYFIRAKNADGVKILAEGNYPTVSPDNGQITFIISTACAGTPDLTDQTQLAEAVAQYACTARSFADLSDVPNVYVATRFSSNHDELPCQLYNGFTINFAPTHENTGASTLTFTTKDGATTTYPIRAHGTHTFDLPSGYIYGTANDNGGFYEMVFQNNVWYITSGPSVYSYGTVFATDSDPNQPQVLIDKLTGGSGISIAPSGDNSQVVISQPGFIGYAQQIFSASQVYTTAISSSLNTGTQIIFKTYTPKSTNSALEIEFSVCAPVTANGGVLPFAVIRIQEGSSSLLANAAIGGGVNPPTTVNVFLRALVINSALTPRTFSIWGGPVSPTENMVFVSDAPFSQPFPVTLTIKELLLD